jgi:2-polyprenyl-3-methyl-5-hydroxy-6-metoxy-1,4-benzoquinol methylase
MMSQAHHHNPQELMRVAQALIQQGNVNNAVVAYHQCMNQFPDFVPAYLHLSHYFLKQRQTGSAMQVLSKALEYSPSNRDACQMLAPLLASFTPQEYHPVLDRDLLLCYAETDVNHQQLARITAQLLLQKYELLPFEKVADWDILIHAIAKDDLWLHFLARGINTYRPMESRLAEVRSYLLQRYSLDTYFPETLIPFASALALQLFANEYVLQTNEEEQSQLTKLQHNLNEITSEEQLITTSLLLAFYQPLINIQKLPYKKLCDSASRYDLLALLLQRSYLDITTEQELAKNILSISAAEDSVSEKVRAQYEQSPYPRWQAAPTPRPTSLAAIIKSLPGFQALSAATDSLDVLVAGCGTGYESIDLARMDKSLNITAIDLSNASLAYAQRMAQKLEVAQQIKFQQGDILSLDQLGKQFDLISSTGVLHHMKNPIDGWRQLCAATKPGGVMRISLYSERARTRVVEAHELIKQLELSSSSEDIKRFRQTIFSMSADAPLAELILSDDFYSMSGCRDLVFHAQEHRFTLVQIAEILSTLKLKLIGFDPPPKAATLFKQHFGDAVDLLNLTLWDEFERDHPDTFVSMYQLWCQKA